MNTQDTKILVLSINLKRNPSTCAPGDINKIFIAALLVIIEKTKTQNSQIVLAENVSYNVSKNPSTI